jgi:undecaprenyl diphosphate synthase
MEITNKPNHIAIIMDGNRRWATERGMPKIIGHTEGAKNVRTIAKTVQSKGISHLTLYALSTENIRERSREELNHLYSLFEKLVDYIGDFLENNAQLRVIGNLSGLPEKTQEKLKEVMEKTKNNTGFVLTLAINYGGRDEIARAVQKILDDGHQKISEQLIHNYLDTKNMPDVDLVIRTGGHQRLSNFLLWQAAYAELYFTETKWPGFGVEELNTALVWFQEQQRNRGK